MNDKIKDHIIHLILEDKEISGKEKVDILRELFDSPTPCMRDHYPTPYPWFQPCPCPPDTVTPTYPPIIYTTHTGNIIDNTGGGTLLPTCNDFEFQIHPNN